MKLMIVVALLAGFSQVPKGPILQKNESVLRAAIVQACDRDAQKEYERDLRACTGTLPGAFPIFDPPQIFVGFVKQCHDLGFTDSANPKARLVVPKAAPKLGSC